jgi:uncharacterized protein YaaW (UPF0174 family)
LARLGPILGGRPSPGSSPIGSEWTDFPRCKPGISLSRGRELTLLIMMDPGLLFLAKCSNDDLAPIADFILKASSTEMLSKSEAYQRAPEDARSYLDEIEQEIRRFGGNTLVNVVRGDGASYGEIARDVAKRLKAQPPGGASIEEVEWAILERLLGESLDKMDDNQRAAVLEAISDRSATGKDLSAGKGASVLGLQAAIRGSGFTAYKAAVQIANGVAKQITGKGLSFAANTTLARSIGAFAGPIGIALSGIWTIYDISGPAYRVTVPVVVHVAMLRLKMAAGEY